MTLLAKRRERRVSLRVSTIWGSPIALSMRSAAVAYASGLRLHSARYSSIDSSSSRLRSKRAAKLLMTYMLISCAARRRRRLVALPASGEVLMEPGGAPSELSLAISVCLSSFVQRGLGEASKTEVFQALLP